MRTDALDQRVEMGTCTEVSGEYYVWGCLRRGVLRWAPDGTRLVWNDGYGAWLAGPGEPAWLLAANNQSTQAGQVRVVAPQSWSTSGQYLLTWLYGYEGGYQAVINVQSGQLIPVPDSGEYPEPVERVMWLPDDRLFLVRRTYPPGSIAPSLTGEVWHIDPAGEVLAFDQTFPIVENADGYPIMTDVTRLASGQLAVAFLCGSNSDYQTRGLYTFTPDDSSLRKVSGLPPMMDWNAMVAWAPDASGALVHFPYASTTLYAPSDGSALYDLTGALGEYVCCFTWLD